MELDKNLVSEFAQLLSTPEHSGFSIKKGTVMAVNGLECEVLFHETSEWINGKWLGYISQIDKDYFTRYIAKLDKSYYRANRPSATSYDYLNNGPKERFNTSTHTWESTTDNLPRDEGGFYILINPISNLQVAYKIIEGEPVKMEVTPCSTFVKCIPGDEVSVLLHDNTATIIGNITSPAITQRDMDYLEEEIEEIS